ncbi:DNA repair protein SbcD/Mre11 [uncultured Gammaproteobacteria bacterium]
MLRLLHTADWHLGQTLHRIGREAEHGWFLDWLLDTLVEQQIDALIIAGDVFDGQNPPTSALTRFYRFLAEARRRLPALTTVIIAGNHDSGARLEAPAPLLADRGVHLIGGLPRADDDSPAPERLLVPLTDAAGSVAAWCVAVPFPRPSELPPPTAGDVEDPDDDATLAGTRRLYALALNAARTRTTPDQALVIIGHCHMTGGQVSEMSERHILLGGVHALPAEIFPEDAAYVALGHLHRPQQVGGRPHVRYSGSPLPLALSEANYPHQVVLVTIEGVRTTKITPLLVPRAVEILRLPAGGKPGSAEETLAALAALPDAASATLPPERWPYVEASILLTTPRPGVRTEIEQAVTGKAARLLSWPISYGEANGSGRVEDDTALPQADLSVLSPDEVFLKAWRGARFSDPPPPELLAAFQSLVTQAQNDS